MAPAMHTEMWQHAATRANVATLRERGVVVVDPDSGRLTGPDSGPGPAARPGRAGRRGRDRAGRRPAVARRAAAQDLAGLRVVGQRRRHPRAPRPRPLPRQLLLRPDGLGAGPGRRGCAGADVTLVAANVDLPRPARGAASPPVTSTADLGAGDAAPPPSDADVVVMAAAPADFTPADRQRHQDQEVRRPAGSSCDLVQTPDVLAGLVAARTDPRQVLVGFAAETADRRRRPARAGPRQAGPQGLRPAGAQRGRRAARSSARPTARSPCSPPDGADGPHAGSKDTLAHLIWDTALRLRSAR